MYECHLELHADFLKVAVKKPGAKYGVFDVLALPFGATGSVSAFLRISSAIHFIGLHMGVLWTAFFDDFTAICPSEDQENVTYAVHCLFKLLGIDFASEGKNTPDFCALFHTLGLQVDVRHLSAGFFTVGHVEKRIKELVDVLTNCEAAESVCPKDLERLHGRLVWFNSYIFGRRLNRAAKVVSRYSRSTSKTIFVSAELHVAFGDLLSYVKEAEPASISRCVGQTWFIFSDGAFEPNQVHAATIGAVLVDPCGRVRSFFGEALSAEGLEVFTRSSAHPIYELEILPVVVSVLCWHEFIKGKQLVFYIDNSAAQAAFIGATGATELAASLVEAYVRMECQYRFFPWFGRVPSHSNISDPASRLEVNHPLLPEALRISVDVTSHLRNWGLASGAR